MEVCQSLGIEASQEPGEAAFYGPKADFVVNDCLGREWQLGTVQLDYNLPSTERFAPRLHRQRQPRASPGDDPPCATRFARTVHRRPHRTFRRQVPAVARPPSKCGCCP